MPRAKRDDGEQVTELLQKLLVLQMHAMGATQERIAKAVGRQTAWVNELLKGLPKGGRGNGREGKNKRI
jgi:hypothetical protein